MDEVDFSHGCMSIGVSMKVIIWGMLFWRCWMRVDIRAGEVRWVS